MKSVNDNIISVICGIGMGLCVGFTIGHIYTTALHIHLKKEAINIGVAEYNSTNGNWQWKGIESKN